jgi:catechol 2,3-dioxygenase-like lactoylglutathione lyase family enzyme
MPLTNLAVVSVPVSDPNRAKAFYRDVLGFDVIADEPMGPDRRWIQLGPTGAQTSITLVTWFESMPPGSLDGVVLATSTLDADYADLTGKGLKLTPIESEFWGRYTTFDDPDGNGYVLQEAPTS